MLFKYVTFLLGSFCFEEVRGIYFGVGLFGFKLAFFY